MYYRYYTSFKYAVQVPFWTLIVRSFKRHQRPNGAVQDIIWPFSAHLGAARHLCYPCWAAGQFSKRSDLYHGEDIEKIGLAEHRHNHVAFIFQRYNLIDYFTPMENVALTSKLSGGQ